jgi:hypothetical protein
MHFLLGGQLLRLSRFSGVVILNLSTGLLPSTAFSQVDALAVSLLGCALANLLLPPPGTASIHSKSALRISPNCQFVRCHRTCRPRPALSTALCEVPGLRHGPVASGRDFA